MNIVVAKGYQEDAVSAILASIKTQGTIEYQGRNTVKSIRVAKQTWNIKLFKMPHFINKVVYRYVRKSKAQRSFEYAQILLEKGFNTPKPIAFAQRSTVLGVFDSYYISEHLSADFTFREIKDDINNPEWQTILQQFTEFSYQLHQSGIHFIDHSPGNTLIVKQPDGGYLFYLVDLNRMNFTRLSYQNCIDNFTRLSLADEALQVIATKYAQLCGKEAPQVVQDMQAACALFNAKRARQGRLKKRLRRLLFLQIES